jgi:ParB-like nuclease domain
MRSPESRIPSHAFCQITRILPVAAIKTERCQFGGQTSNIASGIAQHGLMEPIWVVVVGPEYHVVHGEERFAAVKKLGWTEVPAQVVSPDHELE